MNFSRAGELHRRACRQAALQDGPVGCTLRRAGGLYIKLGCGKGWAGGLPCFSASPPFFAARWTAFLCSPPARPSVFCVACLALQLVLSTDWILEDDMVDGLFFCATLTVRRGGHTPFVQAGTETSDTSAEAVKPYPGSSWEGHSQCVCTGVWNYSAESCGVVRPVAHSTFH